MQFLPVINQAANAINPWIKQLASYLTLHPDIIKTVAKTGAALLSTALAIGAVTRASKLFNAVIALTPAKRLITLLVAGAGFIIHYWDHVGPMLKNMAQHINQVVSALGGWENSLNVIALYMAGAFTLNTIGALTQAGGLAATLATTLGKIGKLGVMTVRIALVME